jgi:hypothetical protein
LAGDLQPSLHHKGTYERGNVVRVVPQLWDLALAVPSTLSQLTATTSHIKNATNITTKIGPESTSVKTSKCTNVNEEACNIMK